MGLQKDLATRMEAAGASVDLQSAATAFVEWAVAPVIDELMKPGNGNQAGKYTTKETPAQLLLAKSLNDKDGARTVGTAYAITISRPISNGAVNILQCHL